MQNCRNASTFTVQYLFKNQKSILMNAKLAVVARLLFICFFIPFFLLMTYDAVVALINADYTTAAFCFVSGLFTAGVIYFVVSKQLEDVPEEQMKSSKQPYIRNSSLRNQQVAA